MWRGCCRLRGPTPFTPRRCEQASGAAHASALAAAREGRAAAAAELAELERPKGEDVPAAAALMASVEAAAAAPPTEAAAPPPPLSLPEGAEEGAGGASPSMAVHPPGYASLPVGELRKARVEPAAVGPSGSPTLPPRCWQVLEASKLPTTGTKDVLLARLQRRRAAPAPAP